MSVVACPKCGGRILETATNFVDVFTQCTSCGHIVEVVEQYNAEYIVKDQEKQIDELSRRLSLIKDQLAQATDQPED